MTLAGGFNYEVELLCDYPQWWRYNVFVMAVGYDGSGGEAVFNNLIDKVYDANHSDDQRTAPPGYVTPRQVKLSASRCAYIDLYVYVVVNTFPRSELIGDSPSFEATLRVTVDGRVFEEKRYEINQWGGLTIVARRIDAREPSDIPGE